MISGCATSQGTLQFKDRFVQAGFNPHFFRERNGLWFSSIGIGSYLGDSDEKTDQEYGEALKSAIQSGINVIDSAINYRSQRSERAFGCAIEELVQSGKVSREELIICTKGGFLPFEDDYPADPRGYFKATYIDTGLLKPEEVAQGCHGMSPAYLEDQLNKSLNNLRVNTIDVYYLHNPETQLGEVDRPEFIHRMRKAFEWLEQKVKEGKIRWYGTATWNGYRVGPDDEDYLSLQELILLAREVGGPGNHFKFVQLPMNVAMPEAWVIPNQRYGPNQVSFLGIAEKSGMTVIGSASLLQAKLAGPLPDFFRKHFPHLKTSAQCSLQFARSVPGLTTALVGMKNKSHVIENMELAKVEPLSEAELIGMFQRAE